MGKWLEERWWALYPVLFAGGVVLLLLGKITDNAGDSWTMGALIVLVTPFGFAFAALRALWRMNQDARRWRRGAWK